MPDLLTATLADASNPLLIVDRQGKTLWSNSSARALFLTKETKGTGKTEDRDISLAEIFSSEDRRDILRSSSNFSILDCQISTAQGEHIRQSVLAIDIGPGDPLQHRLLLAFTSTPLQRSVAKSSIETLATVAHDLKNPLSAIFGYADALLDTPSGNELQPKHRSVLSKIRNTAARSIDMVRNLQLLSELDVRGVMQVRTSVDLKQVIQNVLESTWREDQVAPILEIKMGDKPLMVAVERSQLERVIANLFSNALRYSPAEGKIEIESSSKGDQAVFRITNPGKGIPADDLPYIFERNRRGANSLGTSGSGLGLYIVQKIVRRAGGKVTVQSTEGKTCFEVLLPLSTA